MIVIGGFVVTVDDGRRVFRHGGIAVNDGIIIDVDDASSIAAKYPHVTETIDAAGGVVTPGFVDAHVHLSQHLGRSVLPDTWPESREHDHWLPYWQQISKEDAELSALLASIEMLQAGTTCFSDMTGRFEAEVQARAATAVGIRGIVAETVWDNPPHESASVGDTSACIDSLTQLLERFPFKPDRLVWAGVGLAGMGSASDELLVRSKKLADEYGAVMYLHQSFGEQDTAAYREHAGGLSAVAHFEKLGILGPNLHLVHMIRNSVAEIELLVESGTSLVHCPAASLRWGLGASRTGLLPEAQRRGVNIALGSDSGNYSDFLDVYKQMYLAATIHREASGNPPGLTAESVFEMATINGARALGVSEYFGSLEVGKAADIVIHSGSKASLRPTYDPIRSLVYSAQSSAVDTVIVNGDVVVRAGRCTKIDQDAVLDQVAEAAKTLSKRMGWSTPHAWPVV